MKVFLAEAGLWAARAGLVVLAVRAMSEHRWMDAWGDVTGAAILTYQIKIARLSDTHAGVVAQAGEDMREGS